MSFPFFDTDYDLEVATYYMAYENGVVLDIRTDQEYCSGHLCQAIHIPTPKPPLTDWDKSILAGRLHKALKGLSEQVPLILYCKKGIRAGIAKEILREQQGFKKVMSLGGVDTSPLKEIIRGERQNPFFKICTCSSSSSLS